MRRRDSSTAKVLRPTLVEPRCAASNVSIESAGASPRECGTIQRRRPPSRHLLIYKHKTYAACAFQVSRLDLHQSNGWCSAAGLAVYDHELEQLLTRKSRSQRHHQQSRASRRLPATRIISGDMSHAVLNVRMESSAKYSGLERNLIYRRRSRRSQIVAWDILLGSESTSIPKSSDCDSLTFATIWPSFGRVAKGDDMHTAHLLASQGVTCTTKTRRASLSRRLSRMQRSAFSPNPAGRPPRPEESWNNFSA